MFKGPYAGHAPTGETIELYGMAIATVTDDLQVSLGSAHKLLQGEERDRCDSTLSVQTQLATSMFAA